MATDDYKFEKLFPSGKPSSQQGSYSFEKDLFCQRTVRDCFPIVGVEGGAPPPPPPPFVPTDIPGCFLWLRADVGVTPANVATPVLAPTDIPNCIGWWRADLGVTKDGANRVSQWNDQSGQLNHVFQAVGAKQPIWTPNVINGQPSIVFDGVDDYLQSGAFTGGVAAQPVTIFAITKQTTTIGNWVLVDGDDADHRLVFYNTPPIAPGLRMDMWSTQGFSMGHPDSLTDIPGRNYHVHCGLFNGAASKSWLDGAKVHGAGALGAGGSLDGITLGIALDGVSFPWQSDLVELIIYDDGLSEANRQKVEKYLANRYGIILSIGVWNDQSGQGNHVIPLDVNIPDTKEVISPRPIPNQLNGYPALHILKPNSQHYGSALRRESFVGGDRPQPATIFIVAKGTVTHGTYNILFDGVADPKRWLVFYKDIAPQDHDYAVYGGGAEQFSDITPVEANYHILRTIFNGASSKFYVDGADGNLSGNPGSQDWGGITVGVRIDDPFYGWDGYVVEILAYDSELNAINCGAIENYLKTKYGL